MPKFFVVSEHYTYDNSHSVHLQAYYSLHDAVQAINEEQRSDAEDYAKIGHDESFVPDPADVKFTPCTVDGLEEDDDRWHWFCEENSSDTYFTITAVKYGEEE